jgi:AcrR family transcriptional regulator
MYRTAYEPMNSTSTPTRRRRSLSPRRVTEAALELAREGGVDAITMRRLAHRLDVGTMTLYGYFRNKDELIDAMTDAVTEDANIAVGEGSWREQLGELLRGIRRALDEHPVGVEIRRRRPILSPSALRVSEAGLQILERAGFGRADAARAYRTLWLYVFGFAAFNSPEDPADLKRHVRGALAALPLDEYPLLTSGVDEAVSAMAGNEQFEFGLDLLLDGIEAKLD